MDNPGGWGGSGRPGRTRDSPAGGAGPGSRACAHAPPLACVFPAGLTPQASGGGPDRNRKWTPSREEEAASDPSAAGGLEGRRPRCSLLAGRSVGRAGGPGGAMKLFSLSVLYKGDPKAVLLSAAYDVSSFSFFQRTRWAGRGRGAGGGAGRGAGVWGSRAWPSPWSADCPERQPLAG